MRKYTEQQLINKHNLCQRWAQSHPRQKLLACAKGNAKKKGQEFDITVDDIVIPTHCPILGMELTFTRGKGHIGTNVSIDRLDSTKGYVKGNVWVISHLANRMKQEATGEQLETFAKAILSGVIRHHSEAVPQ